MDAYRSPRGNDDYKKVPFSIEKQNLTTFFNGVYKNALMEEITDCSNLPTFEDWEGPLEANLYEVNMCKVTCDNWPDNMLPGFYKLLVDVGDDKDINILTYTIIIQIELLTLG